MDDNLFFRRREDIVNDVFECMVNADQNGYPESWEEPTEDTMGMLIEQTGVFDDCLQEDLIWAVNEAKRRYKDHKVIMSRMVKSTSDMKFKDCNPVTGRPTIPISWKVLNTPYTL